MPIVLVGTSTLYQMGPFTGDTATIVVASVPEPSSLILGLFGVLAGLALLRRRRKAIA